MTSVDQVKSGWLSSWFNIKSALPPLVGYYAAGVVYQNPTPIINYSAAKIGANIGLSATLSKWAIAPWIAKTVTTSVVPKLAVCGGLGASFLTLGAIKAAEYTAKYALHEFQNYRFQQEAKAAEKLPIPMEVLKGGEPDWTMYG